MNQFICGDIHRLSELFLLRISRPQFELFVVDLGSNVAGDNLNVRATRNSKVSGGAFQCVLFDSLLLCLEELLLLCIGSDLCMPPLRDRANTFVQF